jgi:hypothetical protein
LHFQSVNRYGMIGRRRVGHLFSVRTLRIRRLRQNLFRVLFELVAAGPFVKNLV